MKRNLSIEKLDQIVESSINTVIKNRSNSRISINRYRLAAYNFLCR